MTGGQVSLSVNDATIALDNFVQGYIDHVVGGVLASLKGTGEIKSVDLTIEADQYQSFSILPPSPLIPSPLGSSATPWWV